MEQCWLEKHENEIDLPSKVHQDFRYAFINVIGIKTEKKIILFILQWNEWKMEQCL